MSGSSSALDRQQRQHADHRGPALLAEQSMPRRPRISTVPMARNSADTSISSNAARLLQHHRVEAEHQHAGEAQRDRRAGAPVEAFAQQPPGQQRGHRHVALHHDRRRGDGGRQASAPRSSGRNAARHAQRHRDQARPLPRRRALHEGTSSSSASSARRSAVNSKRREFLQRQRRGEEVAGPGQADQQTRARSRPPQRGDASPSVAQCRAAGTACAASTAARSAGTAGR